MAADWEHEMQDRFDKFQAALTNEFRTQFAAMGTQLEERLETRLAVRLEKSLAVRLEKSLAVRLEKSLTERLEKSLGERLEKRLEKSLTERLEKSLGERLEKRLGERLEKRFDERLTQRLNVQVEQLREIVRTAADNYGGVLSGIKRDVAEFRNEWRQKADDTDKVLANHGGRIAAIEKTLSGRRRPRA